MTTAHIKPYGSWISPITSSMITESSINLGNIVISDSKIYWNETRPLEKGRSVIVSLTEEGIIDLLAPSYNARSSVHEYGGAAFTVHQDTLYFSNFKDGHFYRQLPSGEMKDLTKKDRIRYANPLFDEKRDLIYAIQEEHLSEHDVINSLVTIDKEGNNLPKTIHSGHDFYASCTLNKEQNLLAFLTWDHPNMPWDGTQLWMGKLNQEGSFDGEVTSIAGGKNESIFQPRFGPDGYLYFVSDRTGWWNLYRLKDEQIEPLYPLNAEFGLPQWVFGMSTYCFTSEGNIACVYTVKGVSSLGLLDLKTFELKTLDLPFTCFSQLESCGNTLVFTATSPTHVSTLYQFDLEKELLTPLKVSKEIQIDPSLLSLPETIEFPTENQQSAFAFYYPPKNDAFTAPLNEKPPLIVKSHGGPSAQVYPTFNLAIQYWTSRGFGVLDVNYGGSTGYGRAYRERLTLSWGVVDVDDCTNGALYLANQERVDKNRLAIKGGSAGGYTTLAALTFKNVFKAGTSYYGVSDLETLAQDTHKFESHYLDKLIGPYPKDKSRYIQYSPIKHTDQLSCPVILFQGGEDKVVPPQQAEKMFEALDKKKIPVSYILFEEEGHGFRSAKNIKKALDAELYFYSKVFHFELEKTVEPITIQNLPID